MFVGRKLLIATMHGKEKVIQPLLEKQLGLECVIPKDFNTDCFGTFSGEISRKMPPLATVKEKCLAAMERYGFDLALASEGSFGPHPTLFFLPANEEILMLIDKKNEFQITAVKRSTKTNFAGQQVSSQEELVAFAEKIGFPEHKLNLRCGNYCEKGIAELSELRRAYRHFNTLGKKIEVETDMRAMNNPTRMKVIEQAAQLLLQKINARCPVCNTPGFFPDLPEPGLPCEDCGSPTRSLLKKISCCQKCNHKEEWFFPEGRKTEDPQYCDNCNP